MHKPHVLVLLAAGFALIGAAPPPPAAQNDWPDLEQARRRVIDFFTLAGRKVVAGPVKNRVAIVASGRTRLARVDIAPLERSLTPTYRELDVPEKDGVTVAMRASESLTPAEQKDCAARKPLARSFTLLDVDGRPTVVQHMFSDCLTPALVVGVRTAPGQDASFAEGLARAAMEAARSGSTKAAPGAATK
ncbi:MAG: hypothetical protein QM765_41690 [Myxococcales bacterium]